MPVGWIKAGLGAASLFGGGGGNQGYQPTGNAAMDQQAQQGLQQQMGIAGQGYNMANPAFLQSLQAQQGINYNPMLQGAQQAGAQYGQTAQGAAGQSQNLYGAGNQIYNTAFDPQNALYAQTAGQVGQQINAGQAQRGLGNSPVGAAEYGQGMSNFNIDWQNQQLARQTQGVSAMNQAAQGAGQQGVNAANWLQTAGSLPVQAQQYVAGMPAQNASQYLSGLGQEQGLYGAPTSGAQNYLGTGIQASQYGADAQTAQQGAGANLLYQGVNQLTGPNSSMWGL